MGQATDHFFGDSTPVIASSFQQACNSAVIIQMSDGNVCTLMCSRQITVLDSPFQKETEIRKSDVCR